jgi:hypothetical protein
MDAPIQRSSRVHHYIRAGRYRYTDAPGAPPVEVDVTYEYGEAIVRFPPLDGDEGAEVLLRDMAACDKWRAHFEVVGT